MFNYSNPLFVKSRSFFQKLGILRPLVRIYRKLFNLSYEAGFDNLMMTLIVKGDILWDVGANVGHFTEKFSQAVGPNGRVIAFEPSPETHATLSRNCAKLENVVCENIALSNSCGNFSFRASGITNDPTNGLVETGGEGTITVKAETADEMVKSGAAPSPNAIKIDVEGFEVEVFEGMHEILHDRALDRIFVEVHFLEIMKRGLKRGPTDIVKVVTAAGFEVIWTDPSHFIAKRGKLINL